MKFTPRASASCTTAAEEPKSIRPPKLLPPSPTTETASAELPIRRLRILDDLLDAVAVRGADNGVEHGHAMQYVRNRARPRALPPHAPATLGPLAMQHA